MFRAHCWLLKIFEIVFICYRVGVVFCFCFCFLNCGKINYVPAYFNKIGLLDQVSLKL